MTKHSTGMYQDLKTNTLAGFEPGIFCSEGGRDDHYATPPGRLNTIFSEPVSGPNPATSESTTADNAGVVVD
jgi:hypothetical protein